MCAGDERLTEVQLSEASLAGEGDPMLRRCSRWDRFHGTWQALDEAGEAATWADTLGLNNGVCGVVVAAGLGRPALLRACRTALARALHRVWAVTRAACHPMQRLSLRARRPRCVR